ncbi:MAG: hypothetical protein ACLVLH_15675 [Eisenbergiella massiliensis]
MKVNETLRDRRRRKALCAATDLGFARDISAWCSRTGIPWLHRKGRKTDPGYH